MKRACAAVEAPVPESYHRFVAKNGSRDLTDREIWFFFNWGIEFEGDIDMLLSSCSIGADAPASATFGKTAFADFASARCKMRVLLILVDGMRPDCELPSG